MADFKEKLEKEIEDKEKMLKLVDKYNDTEERYELMESLKITIHKLKGYRRNLNANSAKMGYDNVRKRTSVSHGFRPEWSVWHQAVVVPYHRLPSCARKEYGSQRRKYSYASFSPQFPIRLV